MILAAPLVIPFAKAVGLSVGTLGMAALADKVNDYIETNPEESSMILKTLIPNLGIGEIFMNKEKISIEDLDEMSDQEAADLPTDIKADLMKQGGKSRGGNKRELMKELSKKLGLSGPGKKQKDMEYDADERYEGGVEEKADGGAIGIEVLFGPKRDNFRYGGDTMGGRNDRSRSSPGPDRSRVSAQQQSNHDRAMAAAQNDGPSFKEKVKSIITNHATQSLGGAILTGGMNLALPGALDKLNKARMIKNAIDYARYVAPDEAIEGELENIQTQGGIVPYADGGRVGLFMGGSPLEGEALSIYNSMKAYGNDDQAIADRLQALGMYTPQDSTPDPTPDQGIINQQLNQGGGDGPKGDFGIFGNLLKDTEKTFTKDVYAIDKNMYPGAPMTGSFKPTEITGYQDVTSGLYKTEDGKNINHLGLNIKPGIISLLEKLGFGDLDETQFTGLPYEEGYVAGTFTGKKLSDFFKKQQATNAEIAAANLKAQQELEAKLAAEKAAMERVREQQAIDEAAYRNQPGQYGGDNRQQEREEAGPGYSGSGTAAEMGSFARGGRVEYKDGGLATMFTRRR